MNTIIISEERYKDLTLLRTQDNVSEEKRWKIKEYDNYYFSSKKKAKLWMNRFRQTKLFEL